MKKTIIIIVIGVVLLAGGFFLYKWLGPKEEVDPFTVIPENAALIIETSQIYNVWDDFKTKKVWQNLKAVPSITSLTEKISALDSILGQENKREFFEGKKVLASLHIGPGKSFDYIFYIPINSGKDERFLGNALDNIKGKGKYQIEEREFNGYTIGKLTAIESKISFSFLIYKNLFIGSFSGVLLEDLLKNLEAKKDFFFWKREGNTPQKLVEGKTTLYVRFEHLPSLLSLFSESDVFKPMSFFSKESVLELNINDKELLLNGFTYSTPEKLYFLNCFKNQKPQQFYLKNFIPNNTAALFYYGFDNGKALRKSMEEFWAKQEPAYLKQVVEFNKANKIDLGKLYDDFGKEIGLCVLESDTAAADKLIFIHSSDAEILFSQLNIIETSISAGKNLKADNELWQGFHINEMPTEEFPSMLLGKLFKGFPQCYYANVDQYIVLSNNKESIKNLVKDIESENVWGKTLSINNSLEETITEFNVGVFVNVQKSWESVLNYASPEISEELRKNKKLLHGFDFLAAQFSLLNENVLTNIVLTHNLSEPIVEEEEEEVNTNNELMLAGKMVDRLYLVDNKNSGKDVLIQDSLFAVNMVGSDLKVKWIYPLKSRIAGEVFTVDIGKDRNWEYIFAAGNKIYALDSKGSLVKNFPFELESSMEIQNISVIDYSNTKDYRIAVSEKNGNVYIFNLQGQNLDGWKPRYLTGILTDKVRHVRVNDKDFMIAIQKNGLVHVMNRKAEAYDGFPVDLKSGSIDSYSIQKGKDMENSYLVLQTEKGVVKVNFRGEISRQNGTTILCPDTKGNSFVMVKAEGNTIAILNEDAEKKSILPFDIKNVSIKYHYLSTKGEIISIKDNQTGKLYIYNLKGQLLIPEPVNSNAFSEVFYNERKKTLGLYNLYQSKLEILNFK